MKNLNRNLKTYGGKTGGNLTEERERKLMMYSEKDRDSGQVKESWSETYFHYL